ncbi:uncharacterized protein LOC144095312 [Amblyomma americanum]
MVLMMLMRLWIFVIWPPPHQVKKTDEGSTVENSSCDRARGNFYADFSSACQRYHYCTRAEDGSWRHRLMACPPGTMFDTLRGACGWRKVPCGPEELSTMELEATEHVTQVTSEETASRRDLSENATDLPHTVKTISTNTNEREHEAKTKINRNKKRRQQARRRNVCPSNLGYFPDVKSGCRKYYSCFGVARSTFLKHVFQCPHEMRFDPPKMLCVEASKASPCRFPISTGHKNATSVLQELFNMPSSSNEDYYGFHDLLPSNNTVHTLDRAVAGRIMSYVDTGGNLSNAQLTSVSKLLPGTQHMPLTVLAAYRLLNMGVQRLTNETYVLDRVSSMYEGYGNLFGPDFLDRGRSAVRNLTSLVEESGAMEALRQPTG